MSKNNKAEKNQKNTETLSRGAQQYEEKRSRLNTGARIMAIVVIAAMLITSFLAAGIFLFD